jgi:hypothetical protein
MYQHQDMQTKIMTKQDYHLIQLEHSLLDLNINNRHSLLDLKLIITFRIL